MRRGQRWAVPAVLAMVAAGVVSVGSPVTAAAATATPVQVTGVTYDLGISGAKVMVQAGGKLFIGLGNVVQVRSLTGTLLGSISGESGVSSLAASDDGHTVYAADRTGNAISVIDVATGSERAHWPVSACPTQLALAGALLFYTEGCGATMGIETVDATAGGTPADSGAGTFPAPLLISATRYADYSGALNVSIAVATSAGLINTYAYVEPLTTPPLQTVFGTADLGIPVSEIAVAPDGQGLYIASPTSNGINQYALSDLSVKRTYPVDSPVSGIAFGPYDPLNQAWPLALGMDTTTATRQVYHDTTYIQQSLLRSTYTGATSGSAPLDTVPRTLTLGPDLAGKPYTMSYGLATRPGSSEDVLQVGEASPTVQPRLILGLGSPVDYAQPLLVAVTFPYHPNAPISLKILPNSGPAFYLSATTNQWGVATAKIPVSASGRIFAYYGGDVLTFHDNPGASPIGNYTAPSRTSAIMYGSYVQRGGVLYYHSASSVHLHIQVTPAHAVPVQVVLQVFANGVWLTKPAATFTANKWGDLELFLTTASKGQLYRVKVTTPTNVFNSTSGMTAATFAIG